MFISGEYVLFPEFGSKPEDNDSTNDCHHELPDESGWFSYL
jgi:hypothetical protein